MSTSSEFDVATLNREAAQLETEIARREIERTALAKDVARLTRRGRYLKMAQWFRSPADSFAAYPLVVLVCGPLFVGAIALIVFHWLFASWSVAIFGLLIGTIAALGSISALLFRPIDALLPAEIAETEAKRAIETTRLRDVINSLTEVNGRLKTLGEQRHGLAKSDKLQRAMLLQRNWKSMRGAEWEDYVVEVCRTLGANVLRAETSSAAPTAPGAPATGPRGVIRRAPTTLFVTFSPRRIAAAAVSEVNPFHAAALRQVIDELAQKGCDELGIITNARITAGSKEFARSRRCTLIGEEDFPDFVLGKLPL
jgi:hypothetical protein